MMYSISFPNMLSSVNTKLVTDHDATYQNLRLLLLSDKKGLFGDPYFGTALKRLLYNQADNILIDLVIDEIYTNILIFMPQIRLERKDIVVYTDKINVYVTIKCVNMLDFQLDTYTINLTSDNTGGE